ncbi:c-type cytochrome [Sphingomonas bacterium]|uniref:c-type cytochrome n=1 Tax=Sphingomonas bacterium TaxID=1895847 RepID=UPI001575C832|nr:cytochrome c [Sphingomonas bacterium]
MRARLPLAIGAVIAFSGLGVGRGPAQTVGDSPAAGAEHQAASASGGEQVYRQICQACHMPNAEGGTGAGAIPALAKNPHLADPDFAVNMVLRGKGGMPAFAGMLKPDQVAGVVNYVRTHFGNDYRSPVKAEDVKRLSQGLGDGDE